VYHSYHRPRTIRIVCSLPQWTYTQTSTPTTTTDAVLSVRTPKFNRKEIHSNFVAYNEFYEKKMKCCHCQLASDLQEVTGMYIQSDEWGCWVLTSI